MFPKHIFSGIAVTTATAILSAGLCSASSVGGSPPYLDPSLPVEERVEDLM